MASDKVHEFTDANFDADVLGSDLPVLVDFWAQWCGPCRMLGPIVDEIATEADGKLKVGKLNVDDSGQTATRFGIQSIPALMLFVGGELKETIIGAQPKAQIVAKLSAHVAL
jgi:thioredoxin 1